MVLYDMALYDNRVSGRSRAGGEPVSSPTRAHLGIAVTSIAAKRSVQIARPGFRRCRASGAGAGQFDDYPETAPETARETAPETAAAGGIS
jgi:hypothetical protein